MQEHAVTPVPIFGDGPIVPARSAAQAARDPALGSLPPAPGFVGLAEPLMGHGQNQPVQDVEIPAGITVEAAPEPGVGLDEPAGAVEGQPQHVLGPCTPIFAEA
jgi:hypothetical protein